MMLKGKLVGKKKVQNLAVLTCPYCGYRQPAEIPQDRCIPFYKCEGCGRLVEAKQSCCVFCDYANKPCPVGASGKVHFS